MRFTIFRTAKSQKGELCTYERYLELSNTPELLRLCNDIAAEKDPDKRGELKKRLPAITWQAYFEGKRIAKEAQPSGLFMLDIDHVENPGELYAKKVASRVAELGIVYCGMTASRHGLRIVAKCLPTLHTIEECQRWLASNLKVEFDGVCKDWARCSFLVHDSYTYYMDAKAIWQEEPAEGTVYAVGMSGKVEERKSGKVEECKSGKVEKWKSGDWQEKQEKLDKAIDKALEAADQREGLFGGPTEFKGIPYEQIIKEWFEREGGEPQQGN